MALGKEHQKSNRKLIKTLTPVSIITALIVTVYFSLNPVYGVLASLLGVLFGYLYSPDLDQQSVITINEYETALFVYQLLRKIKIPHIIAYLIKQFIIYFTVWFWKIYSWIPHRHWLSHSHVVSTAIREIYFLVIVLGVYCYVFWTITPLIWLVMNWQYWCMFFVTNCVIDSNHLRLDGIGLFR